MHTVIAQTHTTTVHIPYTQLHCSKMLAKLLVAAVAVTLVAGQRDGTIALSRNGVRSNTYTSGVVEVYYNGEWGDICADNYNLFDQDEADVVCHQLGYESAESHYVVSSAVPRATIKYSRVSCINSSYLVLFQCDVYVYTIPVSCYNAVAVTCSTTSLSANPFNGQVRLTGGDYTSEGLVEVYCNDEWGTICDDFFYTNDANTICKQLGYTGAVTYYTTIANRGTADQPVWYQNPGCFGTESCLTSCSSCGSTNYLGTCSHSEDVSVRCEYDTAALASTSTTGSCDFDDITDALGLAGGVIAAIVIGAIVFVAIIIAIPVIICCCCIGGAACAGCAFASKAV